MNYKKIELKKIDIRHITKKYLNWMNDREVVKFTEQKYKKTTYNDIKKYIINTNKSKNNFIFGIFVDKIHIGNVKISSINFNHKTAEIAYIIGDKSFWNKGIGGKAISLILKIAKKKYKIKKILAGVYSQNKSSISVLIKNGFKREAVFKSQVVFEGKRISSYIYGYEVK
jgi:RimJ/RimL family protein N-acetyltransferase